MKKTSAFIGLVLLLGAWSGLMGADKDKAFKPGTPESYPCRVTQEQVTIAVEPFDKEEETRRAFGRLNPNRYGVLPVLVIIRNDRQETLSLESMRVEYITGSGQRVEPLAPEEVPKVNAPQRPRISPGPWPRTPGTTSRDNPLRAPEIEARAFVARVVPPGETVSGFFYFHAPHRSGARFYITGLREPRTRQELFYFEIPLEK